MTIVSGEFNVELFNVYLETNRYDSALELLRSCLAEDPSNSYYIYLWAYTSYLKDDYIDAISSCVNALNNGYSQEKCQILLGKIYLAMEKFHQSEKCLMDALKENPENPQTLALYSIVMLSMRKKKMAIKYLENAMEKDPDDPVVLDANYRIYLAGRNKNGQIQALNKIMNSGYTEIEKLIRIAMFYQTKKDYKNAREYIKKAYLLAPNEKDLLLNLIELDIAASKWNLPMVLASRIGGPYVIWLAYIVLIFIFVALKFSIGITVLFIFYFSYVLYSRVASWILRSVKKRRLRIEQN